MRLEDGSVRIDVMDDGRGFPFRGRYDLSQLVANEQAPWSLKERITALGGALAIESSSTGSHVELCVPYERARRGLIMRIVLADDHPVFLSGLEHVLRSDPNNEIVERCADGIAALEALRRERPALLIADLSMPGRSGRTCFGR